MKQFVLSPGQRTGDSVLITGKDFHYLANVRRLTVGDRFFALEDENRLELEVTAANSSSLHLKLLASVPIAQAPVKLTLFPFLLKAKKLDDVIRQVCEAGVAAVVPVQGDHCISQLETSTDQAKKLDRWKSITKEAAQQSGSASVCEVHPPITSQELPTWWDNRGPLLFFHQVPLAKTSLHRYLFPKSGEVGLIIGPEGGLSTRETQLLQAKGALPVWLGPNVLRAETASLYAAAAVQIILQEKTEWTIPS